MFLMFFQLIQDRMKANEYAGPFLSSILEVRKTWLKIYRVVLTKTAAHDSLYYGRSRIT